MIQYRIVELNGNQYHHNRPLCRWMDKDKAIELLTQAIHYHPEGSIALQYSYGTMSGYHHAGRLYTLGSKYPNQWALRRW